MNYTKVLTVDIAGAYSANDVLASKFTIDLSNDVFHGKVNDYECVRLKGITVTDHADQGAAFDFVFFDRDFTLTGALNEAWNVSADDLANVVAEVPIPAANYKDLLNAKVAHVTDINIDFRANDGRNIYVATICRGTPTYVAATDLRAIFQFEPVKAFH